MLVKVSGKDTGYRGGRPEPARATTSGDVAALVDLGSRTGDGPTQELHDGDGYTGLLLRSAESLAARLERKHQWAVAAIPAKEIRSISVHSNRSWMQSLCVSITGHEKPWDFELRRINCRPVLHRPLETTPFIRTWLAGPVKVSSLRASRNQSTNMRLQLQFATLACCLLVGCRTTQPTVTQETLVGNYVYNSQDPEEKTTGHNLDHLVLQADGTYDLVQGGSNRAGGADFERF